MADVTGGHQGTTRGLAAFGVITVAGETKVVVAPACHLAVLASGQVLADPSSTSTVMPCNTRPLQEVAAAGLLRDDIDVSALRREMDTSFRRTMLDWASGELPTEALQRSIGLTSVLTLRGAASAQGLALLDALLLRLQPGAFF